MKTPLTALTALFMSFFTFSQTGIELKINSGILGEDRIVDIHIPESYSESELNYPVIYCLDGEYSQMIVNGTVDFYAYIDKTPECIVVSIRQNYFNSDSTEFKRWEDCSYSWKSGLLNEKGERFKHFIEKELIPTIDKEYRTSPYRALIGHSYTASFVNHFLLDNTPLFSAYIAISPYYGENMYDTLKTQIQNLSTPIFYFTTYGENDLSGHQQSVNKFNEEFSALESENFNYLLYNTEGNQGTHYTIYPKALPFAIEFIFSPYAPISEDELMKIIEIEDKVNYLMERYATIEKLYGNKLEVREDDFYMVVYAAQEKKQMDQVKLLSEWCIKTYPENTIGYSLMGEYEEQMKNYEKALDFYQNAYDRLPEDTTNKVDFYEDIERMQKKLKGE